MGIGDEIMASGEARELVRKTNRQVSFGNQERFYYSIAYQNNPLIGSGKDNDCDWISNYPGSRPYLDYELSTDDKIVFKKYQPIPGDILFSDDEILFAYQKVKSYIPFILVEPGFKGKFSADNKNWGEKNWETLADMLTGVTLVQPLHEFSGIRLQSAVGIEVSSFRESCAILNYASYFLSNEGGLHHAAAALRKRGIVIFGGFISSDITGYKNHINIDDRISPLTPCGNLKSCDHCRQAMESIDPEYICHMIKSNFLTKLKMKSFLYRVLPGARFGNYCLRKYDNRMKYRALNKLLK